jgi:hypothetical protein
MLVCKMLLKQPIQLKRKEILTHPPYLNPEKSSPRAGCQGEAEPRRAWLAAAGMVAAARTRAKSPDFLILNSVRK